MRNSALGAISRRAPARKTIVAADATSPSATVVTGTPLWRSTSYMAKPASTSPPCDCTKTTSVAAAALGSAKRRTRPATRRSVSCSRVTLAVVISPVSQMQLPSLHSSSAVASPSTSDASLHSQGCVCVCVGGG